MIIEVEERFCKAAKVFSKMLNKVQLAAERGDAVHEVEEMTWGDLIETGRETIVAFIEEQEEELPRPEVIEHEGKQLQRLPERRVRPYVSAFGPTPFARDVYATRETQRQEVVPLDAKLGMPESDTSYLLQKWSGTQFVKESYSESRITLAEHPWLCSVGQLPGRYGCTSVRACRSLLRPAGTGGFDDGSRDPRGHERLQRRADAKG